MRAASHGPYGFPVGAPRAEGARSLLLFDGPASVHVSGVPTDSPLHVVCCGAERTAWAAGAGFALASSIATVVREAVEVDDPPVAMGLDFVGVPWIVTGRAALRRQIDSGKATWRAVYRRGPGRPPLVAIGFTPEEARIMDACGSSIHVRTDDHGVS